MRGPFMRSQKGSRLDVDINLYNTIDDTEPREKVGDSQHNNHKFWSRDRFEKCAWHELYISIRPRYAGTKTYWVIS